MSAKIAKKPQADGSAFISVHVLLLLEENFWLVLHPINVPQAARANWESDQWIKIAASN
jgi:hypothetical protein